MTDSTPDRWPQTQQLILLALEDDPHVSALACAELRRRIDLPLRIVSDNGRTVIVRREAAP